MQTYSVVKQSPESNSVVLELNAKVYTCTFESKEGIQKGDLYTYKGTTCKNPDAIVCQGTCAPIGAIFVDTVNLEFYK